ncbi:hypothetical protein [Sphingomonas sp. M1A8_2b]
MIDKGVSYRLEKPSGRFVESPPSRLGRMKIRYHVNLVIAQTQQLNERLKIDAIRGVMIAVVLSLILWMVISAAVFEF